MKKCMACFSATILKALVLVFFMLLNTVFLKAQINSFAPIGSTWYYDHTYFWGNPTNDYTRLVTIGDTTIEGRHCSIVFNENPDHLYDLAQSVYLNYESGKVYRYFEEYDFWGLQYDFNALAGDTITCYGSAGDAIFDSIKVRVDSIGETQINGVILRTQYYRNLSGWDFDQQVIEGIGGQIFLFPTYALSENTNIGLRCYIGDTIGYYNTGLVESCDTILFLGMEEPEILNKIHITPTLFSNELIVKNQTDSPVSVFILNTFNAVIARIDLPSFQQKTLDCSSYSDGPYFVQVISNGGAAIKKIMRVSY